MELRGNPAGMTVFYVNVGGGIRTRDGWEGSLSGRFPTFYVVGGNEFDAIENAKRTIRLAPGDKLETGGIVESMRISVTQADFDSDHPTVSWNSEAGTYDVSAGKSAYWHGNIRYVGAKWTSYLMYAGGQRTGELTWDTGTEALAHVVETLNKMTD